MDAIRPNDRETGEQRLYQQTGGALIWSFRKSRDRWKKKHQDLRATVKGFKNQVAAVTKSREQWRLKAERASKQVADWKLRWPVCGQIGPQTGRKKTRQQGGPLELTQAEQSVPCGQQYPVGVASGSCRWCFSCGASLQCTAKVLGLLGSVEGHRIGASNGSTGRLWLLRIGLAALLRPKVIGTDWVWMVDHSIQIGSVQNAW